MSKLFLAGRIPPDYNRQTWSDILRQIEIQVNNVSEGVLSATHNATTSPPTTGTHGQGDFVKNSEPVVLGTTPNRFVVYGWIYSGTSWWECRFTVGNEVVSPSKGSVVFTGLTPTVA